MNNITLTIADQIAKIHINRPNQLNALNRETIAELSQAFTALENNQTVRVILLRGAGEKAFIAGADIKEFAGFNVLEGKTLSRDGHLKLFNKVETLSKPVIALVNGFALGGGLELAMACHIRIASKNAKLGLPEVSLGVIPGYGGTQRLTQLVGKGKAMEMILSAGMISAEEALTYGLVTQMCELSELDDFGVQLAQKIIKNAPSAIKSAISSVNALFQYGIDGMEKEIEEFGNCFGTHDFIEGTTAFLEKRKANFNIPSLNE